MTEARTLYRHPRRHALGLDVGGTKIAGGIVDLATGAVTGRRQVPTDFGRSGRAILDDTLALAQDLARQASHAGLPVAALGLGVAELVSPQGRVFSDHRIRWSGLDVAAELGQVLPATVSADVRAAALGEARFGAGRGLESFFYVTIGTGVSGVLVLNGRPHVGARGAALVIANSMERHPCPACGHVTTGMVEDVASGPGLALAYGATTAEEVLQAARAGDARALHVIDHAAGALGRILALMADALDPQAMVIGGGLGSAPGPYFAALTRAIRAGLWDGVPNPLKITQAALGPDAGLIGAACATQTQPEPADRPPLR